MFSSVSISLIQKIITKFAAYYAHIRTYACIYKVKYSLQFTNFL